MFSFKCFIFMLVAWKDLISFKIKKKNILNVSLITNGFVSQINVLCLTFDVFSGELVGSENNVKICCFGKGNTDASTIMR